MNNSLYNILSESNLIKNIINEESNINNRVRFQSLQDCPTSNIINKLENNKYNMYDPMLIAMLEAYGYYKNFPKDY